MTITIAGITFPDADFYDCSDDTLSHTSPEEAIEDELDKCCEPGCSNKTLIEDHGTLRVTAYRRGKMNPTWVKNLAERLLETALIDFEEVYRTGCEEGFELTTEQTAKAQAAIEVALAAVFTDADVLDCVEVGHVDLTPEQTEAIMRQCNPEWFEEEP